MQMTTQIPITIINNIPNLVIKHYQLTVDGNLTLGQLLLQIRNFYNITNSEGLYLFINNTTLEPNTTLLIQVYERYKDSDNNLYIHLYKENTFG